MRGIYLSLFDGRIHETKTKAKLLTDEQAAERNKFIPKENPWRWHRMTQDHFDMLNPPTEEVIVMKEPAAAVAEAGDARETAWARVLGGEAVECKAYDDDDRKWYDTVLQLNTDGKVVAEDTDGLFWHPTAEDILDPKQFKF